MRLTSYHYYFLFPLLIITIVPSIAAGGIIQPGEPGKVVSGGYWSNQITGPDYAVPESAFNPPDRGDWDAWYGGFASGGQDTGAMPSPYRYGTPGGLLPFNPDETLPAANSTEPSIQVSPVSPYPRAISPMPIGPPAAANQTATDLFVGYVPSAYALLSPWTGTTAVAPVPSSSIIPIIFPAADLPDLPDTGNTDDRASTEPAPATGQEIYISDLNVRDEYVKITNNGLTPVTMTGWKIVAGSSQRSISFIDWPLGNGRTFSFTLYPLTTVTVYYGKSGTVTATELYWPSARDAWNDAGDTAFLYDSDGHLVSSLSR
jgi:hypothetical protein